MYLTALHVVGQSGLEGINAFCYSHGGATWEVPPLGIPDENPGMLVVQQIEVPPGGNRVRAFLDVVAPDNVFWEEIRLNYIGFISATQLQPFPRSSIVGRFLFRVGMDRDLARHWHLEIANLYRAIIPLPVPPPPLG